MRKSSTEFEDRLRHMGMEVKPIVGDGNCLFRTMSDQLHQQLDMKLDHRELRRRIVEHIAQQRQDFEPFIDADTEPVERYCKRMAQDAVYGGYLELVAFTRLFTVDALILQDDGYVYKIKSPQAAKCCLRFAYRSSYEHYDSINVISDAAGLEQALEFLKDKDPPAWMIHIVVKSTGVTDAEALQALLKHQSKVDEAIEYLLSHDLEGDQENQPSIDEVTASSAGDSGRKLSARERKEKAKKDRKLRKKLPTVQVAKKSGKEDADDLAAKVRVLDI